MAKVCWLIDWQLLDLGLKVTPRSGRWFDEKSKFKLFVLIVGVIYHVLETCITQQEAFRCAC